MIKKSPNVKTNTNLCTVIYLVKNPIWIDLSELMYRSPANNLAMEFCQISEFLEYMTMVKWCLRDFEVSDKYHEGIKVERRVLI